MSAKKGFEIDTNTDSGFLSGPIDQLPEELRDEPETTDASDKNVKSEEVECIDSGFLELSQGLGSLRVSEAEGERKLPHLRVTDEDSDIPPLDVLFQQDDDGDTQLHIAAVHGCQKSVSTLIRVCPDRYWLDVPNDFGHTALHLAVMSGNAVVARMLVQAGASLGVRDLNGDTPIHTATTAQHIECLQALLAPVDNKRQSKQLAAIMNLKNYDGQTCVHLAATSGHLGTLQTLLFYGADVNAREGLAGWTALHIAARRGDVRLSQYLMEKCPSVTRVRDYASRTAKRLARRSQALSQADYQRLFRVASDDSDSESDTEDEYEYDSDDGESLFEKLKGSFSVAPVVTN